MSAEKPTGSQIVKRLILSIILFALAAWCFYRYCYNKDYYSFFYKHVKVYSSKIIDVEDKDDNELKITCSSEGRKLSFTVDKDDYTDLPHTGQSAAVVMQDGELYSFTPWKNGVRWDVTMSLESSYRMRAHFSLSCFFWFLFFAVKRAYNVLMWVLFDYKKENEESKEIEEIEKKELIEEDINDAE